MPQTFNGKSTFFNTVHAQNPSGSPWYYGATDDSANDIITQWFMPGRQQEKQFMQQMFAIDYQNAYNDPAAQMERMKRAGINPNTAAAGIAGSQNLSASPSVVPSTPQGITPADIAGVANAVTGGAASLADAAFKLGTLDPTIQNLTADYDKKLSELGLTNEQIVAWKIDNKYREQNAISDLLTKSLNQENLRQNYKVLESTYQMQLQQTDNLIKQLEVYAADINNKEAQAQLNEALAQKAVQETEWQKLRLDYWKSNGFDIMSSTVDAILVQKLENGHDISDLTNGLARYNNEVSYQSAKGAYSADEETAYNRAYNSATGAYNSDPYLQQYRKAYDTLQSWYDLKECYQSWRADLKLAFDAGTITQKEYDEELAKINSAEREIKSSIRELDKQLTRLNYGAGHVSQAQEILNDLAKIGITVGVLKGVQPSPTQVRGFGR